MLINRKSAAGLVAELFVVILGVMIALAADNWREDWAESQVEQRYLQRLASDLKNGIGILGRERENFSRVRASAVELIEAIEDDARLADDDFLIHHFIEAGQHGVDRWEMVHDVTFREMLESGQLGLIDDPDLREGLINYYRDAEWLIGMLTNLPFMNKSFIEATGLLPIEYGEYDAKLTAAQRAELLAIVREDPELLRLLRLLHGSLTFTDRLFTKQIGRTAGLLTEIEAAIN